MALCLVFNTDSRADGLARRQILVLHSYHKAEWTDAILSGIDSVFGARTDLEWSIEYMDTKRDLPENYLQRLTDVYVQKYLRIHVDLVITSDDTAFRYALDHQHDILDSAPIVFCGVNRFDDQMIDNRDNVTGVLEKGDFLDTLRFAVSARPEARRIYVICDSTTTAQINLSNLQKALAKLPHELSVVTLDDICLKELSAALTDADPSDFAFFISFWRDADGDKVSPEELATAFQNSRIPVFGRSEWMIGRGLVGGKCVSGFNQGRAAALMAQKILNKVPVHNIPVLRESPNEFLFDYRMLVKHAIPESILPDAGRVVAKPAPFYTVPKPLLILLLTVFLFVSLLSTVLLVSGHRRRRMEAALRHSEQRFRDLVESTSDFIWEVNAEGQYTYVSPRIIDVLGYKPAEVIGLTPFDLMSEEEARRVRVEFDEIVRDQRAFQHLININIHKDGRHVALDTNGVPFHDRHGRLSGYRGIDRDVTENRRFQERMQQSQKMEALGQLSGGIAHDFNNLLGGIIGSAELLKLDHSNEPAVVPHLDVILQSASAAADLTRQLLSFSRQRRMSSSIVDLNTTVADVRNLLERSIDKRIDIVTDTAPQPCEVTGDSALLQSAVLNLCINACDAMSDGGSLTLLTRHIEWVEDSSAKFSFGISPGPCVQVVVRDTGTGIDKDTMARMFEPFYTTKTTGRGTGLGLTGVYGTTREHGGAISVNSAPESGTEFTLSFPKAKKSSPSTTTGSPTHTHQPGHILVVDDDHNIRSLLCNMLKRMGHTVISAEDGCDGLRRFKAEGDDIDLIILDLRMPQMDGRECLESIRATGSNVPVIIASGLIQQEDIPMLEKAGITAIIHKPYRIHEIADAVEQALSASKPVA